MSTPTQTAPSSQPSQRVWQHLPSLPEALGSLLSTVVVALFLLTFIVQPFLIPSESMEHTLLVGDFLLVNKQVFAPSSAFGRHLLPYRQVQRGDVVVFHYPEDPKRFLVKRVVGVPGDHLHIHDGKVTVNGNALEEPYVSFEPAPPNPFRDNFPAKLYTDPAVDPAWWKQLQGLTQDGDLVVPEGRYFMLGDNRNHSYDSRSWGLVSRQAIVARPLVIYFSVTRPSTTDVQQVTDDKLGHDGELSARLAAFARWKRIFRVVH